MNCSQETDKNLRKLNTTYQRLAYMTQNAETNKFHIPCEASVQAKDKNMEVEKLESSNVDQTSKDKEKDTEKKKDRDDMLLKGKMQVEVQDFVAMENKEGRS